MGDIERQLRWALICGIDVALMDTDSVTAGEERNADNRHFRVYMRSAVIGHS
ncbi:unnamed protein product [Staurois parvus]|uniref:Uncharacterized protein n=1 Tax=Staurois parvus TaxID=386267 RepID=A0ABN9B7W7_9NEOB|nr:unnamed protein product [Staurois parvus]